MRSKFVRRRCSPILYTIMATQHGGFPNKPQAPIKASIRQRKWYPKALGMEASGYHTWRLRLSIWLSKPPPYHKINVRGTVPLAKSLFNPVLVDVRSNWPSNHQGLSIPSDRRCKVRFQSSILGQFYIPVTNNRQPEKRLSPLSQLCQDSRPSPTSFDADANLLSWASTLIKGSISSTGTHQ